MNSFVDAIKGRLSGLFSSGPSVPLTLFFTPGAKYAVSFARSVIVTIAPEGRYPYQCMAGIDAAYRFDILETDNQGHAIIKVEICGFDAKPDDPLTARIKNFDLFGFVDSCSRVAIGSIIYIRMDTLGRVRAVDGWVEFNQRMKDHIAQSPFLKPLIEDDRELMLKCIESDIIVTESEWCEQLEFLSFVYRNEPLRANVPWAAQLRVSSGLVPLSMRVAYRLTECANGRNNIEITGAPKMTSALLRTLSRAKDIRGYEESSKLIGRIVLDENSGWLIQGGITSDTLGSGLTKDGDYPNTICHTAIQYRVMMKCKRIN